MSITTHAGPRATASHPHANSRIRVLLADDHPVVRRGIAACLEASPHLKVVGEAADGQEALSKARALVPDVLLADNDMPHLSGLAVTEALHRELPKIKVLICSMRADTEYVLRCAQAGAKGYLSKDALPEEFVRAVETISQGQAFFSPEVARNALTRFVRGSGSGPELSQLSNREREVLLHISEGLCTKEIACRLNLGTRTIETHRQRLMAKLDIHSIAGLTRFAVEKGLASLPAPAII
jgi:two-component system, NarL family, nitrate/nitrite response regulator NarL